MDCPEPFPWALLFGVLGTLVGAILGGWLGHYFATKQSESERRHQDRTRFHEDRLQTYSRFAEAEILLRALADIIADGNLDPDRQDVRDRFLDHAKLLSDAYGRLKIIATKSVRDLAERILHTTNLLRESGAGANRETLNAAHKLSDEFMDVVRTELGIDVTS